MDKPLIGSLYYYIELNDDWSQMTYASKNNAMDQIDRYNFAAGNWALALPDLEAQADLLLKSMTRMEDAAIAALLFAHAQAHE